MNDRGDTSHAKSADGSTDHASDRGDLGRTQIVVSDQQQAGSDYPAVPADSPSALAAEEKRFDYKVEKITSSILVVLCFTLNWYSSYMGHTVYAPDWVIGIVLGGYGAPIYQWLKDRAQGKQ